MPWDSIHYVPYVNYEPAELTEPFPTATAKINQKKKHLFLHNQHQKGLPAKRSAFHSVFGINILYTMTDDLRGGRVKSHGVNSRLRRLGSGYVLIQS